MIDINLVPEHLRRRRKAKSLGGGQNVALPREMLVGMLIGMAIFFAAVHVLLQIFIGIKVIQLKGFKKQLETVSYDKARTDLVMKDLKELREKIQTIDKIAGSSKILWSQRLEQISEHLPRGVWLTRVSLDDAVLLIHGSSVSKTKTEMINVHTFIADLKKDTEFAQYFNNIELNLIKSRKINETQIADFIIKADLKK